MRLAQALESLGDEVALVALFGAPLPSICDDVDLDDEARFLCDLVNFANCFTGTKARVDYDELLGACRRQSDSKRRWPKRNGKAPFPKRRRKNTSAGW